MNCALTDVPHGRVLRSGVCALQKAKGMTAQATIEECDAAYQKVGASTVV